jgi:hypothetical protein
MSLVYVITDPLTVNYDLIAEDLATANLFGSLPRVQAIYLGGQEMAARRLQIHQISALNQNKDAFVSDREFLNDDGNVSRIVVDLLDPAQEIVFPNSVYNLFDVNTTSYIRCEGFEQAKNTMLDIQHRFLKDASLDTCKVYDHETLLSLLTPNIT